MSSKEFGPIFWLHLTIIILNYSLPFLFRWQVALVWAIVIYLQEIFLKGCMLTYAQFGQSHETFYHHYLTKMGFKLNKKRLNAFLAWALPIIILLLAICWQLILGMEPLIF